VDRAAYQCYLDAFNARDYDAVLAHYADSFELVFAGYVFKTAGEVRRLYTFLHAYINESLTVRAYVCDASMVALEADVRLEAVRDLTREALASQGLDRLVALKAGDVAVIPQFIHYHLEHGKIVRALCAIYEPPRT
jgi:ketosteroid isomerase-like protein